MKASYPDILALSENEVGITVQLSPFSLSLLLSLLNGLPQEVFYWSNLSPTERDDADAAYSNCVMELMTPVTSEAQVFPQRTDFMFHANSWVFVGNPMLIVLSENVPYQYYARQSVAAQSDAFGRTILLDAGEYIMYVWRVRASNGGIIGWSMDGVPFGDEDTFAGAGTWMTDILSVTIDEPGAHSLLGSVYDKNPSSTGYNANLIGYYLTKAES